MSEDEGVLLLASVVVGGISWLLWLRDVWRPVRMLPRRAIRWSLTLAPVASAALLFATLKQWASFDVRDAPVYLFQYLALGAAWTGVAVRFSGRVGVEVRDDAIERGSAAAAWALGGGIVGLTLCYAGANVGDGPGWWVVVYCAGLSTVAHRIVWWLLHWISRTPDALTIERETAAGIRVAGLLVATGALFGRGAAGDWHGAVEALESFGRVAWLGLALAIVGAMVERLLAPTPARPRRPVVAFGVVPGLAYVGAAVVLVLLLGPPV